MGTVVSQPVPGIHYKETLSCRLRKAQVLDTHSVRAWFEGRGNHGTLVKIRKKFRQSLGKVWQAAACAGSVTKTPKYLYVPRNE